MTSPSINNKKDILLLLLYSGGVNDDINEPIIGKTRLVKMLFLFNKEALHHFKAGTNITEENFYSFFPWLYGPFSREIYDDITFFQLRDFVELRSIESENGVIDREEDEYYTEITGLIIDRNIDTEEPGIQEITLTEKGISFTQRLYEALTSNQKSFLKQFKKKFNSTPLRAILRYVYKTYPESTTNSIVKDNILGDD